MESFFAKDSGRVDVILSNYLNNSRNQVSDLIKKQGILVNETRIFKPSFKILIHDKISFQIIKKEQINHEKVDFDVEILYEDEDLLVVNKPPNLTVHPAKSVKEATLLHWLKSKNITLSSLSGEERMGIVHRIDKQTSGALLVAKNNISHANLSKQLENKTMGRYYYAIIDLPLKDKITIQKPIARNPKNRLKMAIVENARYAKTLFVPIFKAKDEKTSLIAAKLYTGRTHQIRVHLNSISRHILGDVLYGFKSQKDTIPRVMLHASLLYFIHPKSNVKMQVKAPLFEDFNEVLSLNFQRSEIEKINNSSIIEYFDDNWLCE